MNRRILVQGDTYKRKFYLTQTEMMVVKGIAEGKTTREIAKERKVSWRTVEVHRHNILKRLKCKNVAHLIATLFLQKVLPVDSDTPLTNP